MQRREISFTGDVCGEAYHELIDAARTLGGTALLVERPSLGMSRRGQEVLDNLQTVLIGEKKQSEWPGTKLLDEYGTVRLYTLNDFLLIRSSERPIAFTIGFSPLFRRICAF